MFGFPEKNREEEFQYRRNFLQSVIFRIDYPYNEGIVSSKDFFKNTFKEIFPNISDIVDTKGVLRFEEKTPIFEPQSSSEQGIELKSKDLRKNLKITDNFIAYSVEGGAYTNFEDGFAVVEKVVEAIQEKNIDIRIVDRIAIRKTNIIDFTVSNEFTIIDAISSMFNNVLNKSLLELPERQLVNNYNQTVGFSKMPYWLNLNYGYRQGPDQNSWKALLDIDIFKAAAETLGSATDINQVKKEFAKINNEIFSVFHWSLQDSLINELEKS